MTLAIGEERTEGEASHRSRRHGRIADSIQTAFLQTCRKLPNASRCPKSTVGASSHNRRLIDPLAGGLASLMSITAPAPSGSLKRVTISLTRWLGTQIVISMECSFT